MNQSNTSSFNNRNIVLNIDDTFNKLKLKSISYSMYKSLLCPVKYYLHYIIKQDIFNYYILRGIVIHSLYEKAFLEIKHNNRNNYFQLISIDDIEKEISEVIDRSNKDIKLDNRTKNRLIYDIQKNLNQTFIDFIYRKVKNDWKLYIEQPNRNQEALYIINSDVDLYTKADIILKKDDKVEIIDIKTGNIYPEYIQQVIFYLYSYILYSENKDSIEINHYIGSFYSTKLNRYQIMLYTSRNYIEQKFNFYIKELNTLYDEMGINNINDIRSFVEKYLTSGSVNLSKNIVNKIKKLNNCNFCNVKSICPILDNSKSMEFHQFLVELPVTEKKVILQEPQERIPVDFFNK